MKNDKNENGLIWYHAMCLDVLLDTSFTVKSYYDCQNYCLQKTTTFNNDENSEAKSRLFANLWLWCVRHNDQETSLIWKKKFLECYNYEQSSLNNTFTGLRVMEALTVQLAFDIEGGSMVSLNESENELKDVIKLIKSAVKISNCFFERFELHRIHFAQIMQFKQKRLKQLDKLMNMALKHQSYYAFNLIKHTQRSWRHQLVPWMKNFWLNHSTNDDLLNLSQISIIDRAFPFSLPIPKSGNF